MNKQDLKDLAQLRKRIDDAKTHAATAQEKLEASPEYLALQVVKDTLKDYQTKADELTAKIKTDALAEYNATKEKPTLAGLALRVNHSLKYDLDAVKKWAKDKMPELFKFDQSAFEKYAMAVATTVPVPDVKIVDEPSITIATDLSDYLKE